MRRGLMRTVLTKALNSSEPATPGTGVVPTVTSKARILMSASDRRRWLKNPIAVSVNRTPTQSRQSALSIATRTSVGDAAPR